MNDDLDRSRQRLACLTEPSRFRIALALIRGERCVTSLAAIVGLSQSCTTRHLQALEREDLVTRERAGRRVLYRLRFDRSEVESVRAMLEAPADGPPAGDREESPDPGVTAPAGGAVSPGAGEGEASPPDAAETSRAERGRVPSRRGEIEDYLL